MSAFGLRPAEVEALDDERFMVLAGQALFMRQKTFEALERVIGNGVATGFGGKKRSR